MARLRTGARYPRTTYRQSGKRRRGTSRIHRPEEQIQIAIIEQLQARGADNVVSIHIPNQGKRAPQYTSKLIRMGMRPGASDLVFAYRGCFYALELKAPGGRTQTNQLKFLEDVRNAGGFAELCEGLDEAITTLENWGILKRAQC